MQGTTIVIIVQRHPLPTQKSRRELSECPRKSARKTKPTRNPRQQAAEVAAAPAPSQKEKEGIGGDSETCDASSRRHEHRPLRDSASTLHTDASSTECFVERQQLTHSIQQSSKRQTLLVLALADRLALSRTTLSLIQIDALFESQSFVMRFTHSQLFKESRLLLRSSLSTALQNLLDLLIARGFVSAIQKAPRRFVVRTIMLHLLEVLDVGYGVTVFRKRR
jgi:hypothetical protein